MLYDNIMVPYDGSESAQAALAEAVRYAREDPGAALHIVQIVDTEQLVIELSLIHISSRNASAAPS